MNKNGNKLSLNLIVKYKSIDKNFTLRVIHSKLDRNSQKLTVCSDDSSLKSNYSHFNFMTQWSPKMIWSNSVLSFYRSKTFQTWIRKQNIKLTIVFWPTVFEHARWT